MKAIKKEKQNSNKNLMGLLNLVRVEFDVTETLFDALEDIKRDKGCTMDDLLKEALNNYANRFIKPASTEILAHKGRGKYKASRKDTAQLDDVENLLK